MTTSRTPQQPTVPHQRRHARLSALGLTTALLLPGAVAAAPAGEKATFNIQAQDLASGLVQFAEQAHVQLVASADDIGARKTAGISGSYTSEEALRLLLADSGLSYNLNGGAAAIVRAPVQVAQAQTAAPAARTAAATTAAPARAQLEEVTVTAQKREEQLQDVPIAITALTSADMEKKGITSFEGIARDTPSITFMPHANSSNTLVLYMRGQGFNDPNQLTADGAVGMYLDGFYIARPQAGTFDMADVERVEVLRGPQGTLYGRNTTGGAVNMISKQPTGEFGFKQTLNIGTRDLFRSLTAVNLPEWNNISTKLTFLRSSVDGWVKNTGSSHDYGEEAQQAGRLQVRWAASDSVDVGYFYELGNLDSTPTYFQNSQLNGALVAGNPYYANPHGANGRTYKPIDLDLSTAEFEGHGLTVTWDASADLTIKSLTGYRELDFTSIQNFADAPSSAPGVSIVGLNNNNVFKAHQVSQEVQALGSLLDGQINYVAGLYYFKESGSQANLVNLPAFFLRQLRTVKAEAVSKAVFGQLSWRPVALEDRLELTVGARFTKDRRTAERFYRVNGNIVENGAATGTENDSSYSRFNPSFTANYAWTDTLSTYAKVTTGYKAGGSFVSGPVGTFNVTFAPEEVTSYEIGMKSDWFERRMRLNVAAFEYKYTDMQLPITADPANGSVFQVYNAGESTTRGLEIDLQALPTDDLTVNFSYAYLDPKFDKIDVIPSTIFDSAANPVSPYSTGDNIKDVFTLPFAPKQSVGVGADYTLLHFDTGTLAAHVDYRWQDEVYVTSAAGPAVPGRNFAKLPAQGFLNASFTLALDLPRGDSAKITIWGKNLTNRNYELTGGPQGAAFPIQSPTSGLVSQAGYFAFAGSWTSPPSYGVQVQYEY